jgi:hypothetical protein
VAGEISFLEEIVLHRSLVDGYGGGKETETEDDGKTDSGADIYLKAPYHWNWDECEEKVGRNVDGRVKHANVLEDVGVVAFCGSGGAMLETIEVSRRYTR